MGFFEFLVVMALISTAGKFVGGRRNRRELRVTRPEGERQELEQMRGAMDDLSGRLERLEQERDFYKELLDAPGRRLEIQPGGGGAEAPEPSDERTPPVA